jgi:hypothetical protein
MRLLEEDSRLRFLEMGLIYTEMRVKKRKKNLSTISIIYPQFS